MPTLLIRKNERKCSKQLCIYKRLIRYLFSVLLDDKCQFWLNETTKVLTSPYFDGSGQYYYHNLNCTWMLKAEQGFYINFEIGKFMVKNNAL